MFIRNRLRVVRFLSGALELSPPNPYMRVPEIPPVLPHTRAGFRLANDTLLRAAPFRTCRRPYVPAGLFQTALTVNGPSKEDDRRSISEATSALSARDAVTRDLVT